MYLLIYKRIIPTCSEPLQRYGGPLEIIEHGVSEFHVDLNKGNDVMALINDFLEKVNNDPVEWEKISNSGIERV